MQRDPRCGIPFESIRGSFCALWRVFCRQGRAILEDVDHRSQLRVRIPVRRLDAAHTARDPRSVLNVNNLGAERGQRGEHPGPDINAVLGATVMKKNERSPRHMMSSRVTPWC